MGSNTINVILHVFLYNAMLNDVYHYCWLQLRVRELESSLDVEKSANMESGSNVDRLTKQLRFFIHFNTQLSIL